MAIQPDEAGCDGRAQCPLIIERPGCISFCKVRPGFRTFGAGCDLGVHWRQLDRQGDLPSFWYFCILFSWNRFNLLYQLFDLDRGQGNGLNQPNWEMAGFLDTATAFLTW